MASKDDSQFEADGLQRAAQAQCIYMLKSKVVSVIYIDWTYINVKSPQIVC